jgi:hypothetical protein
MRLITENKPEIIDSIASSTYKEEKSMAPVGFGQRPGIFSGAHQGGCAQYESLKTIPATGRLFNGLGIYIRKYHQNSAGG